MRCISAAYAVIWCVSVTFVSCVKTNKDIFEIFSPFCSQAILVFPCQTGWRYSDGNPRNGGIECRWDRQKTRFWRNIWLRCIQVYSVINCTSREVWRPLFVVRARRRSVCDGFDIIRRRRRSNPLDTTPLISTLFSAII